MADRRACDPHVLLDLKHLLLEARQKLPAFMTALGGAEAGLSMDSLDELVAAGGEVGCGYCGGLGHRIVNCPKLEAQQHKQASALGRHDFLANSDF